VKAFKEFSLLKATPANSKIAIGQVVGASKTQNLTKKA
jgi:hypothetical protein